MLLRYIGHENPWYLGCFQGTSVNTATLSMSASRITQAESAWQRESNTVLLHNHSIYSVHIGFKTAYHFGWSNCSMVTGPLELPSGAIALQQYPAYRQLQHPKPLPATGRDDLGTTHQPKILHSSSDVLVKSPIAWTWQLFSTQPFCFLLSTPYIDLYF